MPCMVSGIGEQRIILLRWVYSETSSNKLRVHYKYVNQSLKMEVFIKSKFIDHIETDEVDEIIRSYFNLTLPEDDEDGYVSLRIKREKGWGWSADTPSIPIGVLEKILSKLKAAGADTVSIDFHEDHGTYLIDGYEMTLSDQESELQRQKQAALEKLRAQREKAEQELKRISHEEDLLNNEPSREL